MAANKTENKLSSPISASGSYWGRGLFIVTLVITLVFFWWLLLYSHGVTPHHG